MSKILVVEDEPNQRLLYQIELEDEGYRVITASEGREALQLVRKEHPDLVVLDLRIPGMDGVAVLERMMGLNSKLPVIIYSAYDIFRDDFMTWAAEVYLVKSSNVDVLKGEIQRVLSERKEQQQKVWQDEER